MGGQQGPPARAGRTPRALLAGNVLHRLPPKQACCTKPPKEGGGVGGRGAPLAEEPLRTAPPNPGQPRPFRPITTSRSGRGGRQHFLQISPAQAWSPATQDHTAENSPDALSPVGAETLPEARAPPLRGGRPPPGPPPRPLYLNSFSLFPRRSRTSQWELKASWGGMPQRMMALRKAFRWRALKPSTWAGRGAGWGRRQGRGAEEAGAGPAGAPHWGRAPRVCPSPTSPWRAARAGPSPPAPRLCSAPRGRALCPERGADTPRDREWECGGAAGPHLDIATNARKKRWQGLVPVALELSPGLSPTTWGKSHHGLSEGPRAP